MALVNHGFDEKGFEQAMVEELRGIRTVLGDISAALEIIAGEDDEDGESQGLAAIDRTLDGIKYELERKRLGG